MGINWDTYNLTSYYVILELEKGGLDLGDNIYFMTTGRCGLTIPCTGESADITGGLKCITICDVINWGHK